MYNFQKIYVRMPKNIFEWCDEWGGERRKKKMSRTKNIQQSIAFAKIVKKLKCPELIKNFVQNTSDKNLANFYRIIANLVYSERFAQDPLVRKKLPKLKKIMQPYRKKWTQLTKKASKNPREKRNFFIEQTGNGNIMSIVSSLLPMLLAFL